MPLLNGAIVIRYPDGDYEYVVSASFAPTVGMRIKRKNAWWTVTEVVESSPITVYIAPASGPQNPPPA